MRFFKDLETNLFDVFTVIDNAITEGIDNATSSAKLKDNGDNYSLRVDIPGFEKEEIDIDIVSNILYLKAKNAEGRKSLSFYVPKNINKEAISASLKNGQITIILPKASTVPPSTIKVRIG
jgi:HSP20 family protein